MKATKAKTINALVLTPNRQERSLQDLVAEMLPLLGEDADREGLQRTPARVAKAIEFLTSGYRADILKIVDEAPYSVPYDQMVIVTHIEFFSLCEHHLLPFYGKMH